MTDADDPLDELVSAVLDGEATDDERARVAADPALQRRLAELGAIATAVAEPPTPLPPPVADDQIAAALDAWVGLESRTDRTVAPVTGAEVVDLGAARSRRRPARQFALGAAAALVVVVGAALLVVGTGEREETAFESVGEAITSDDATVTDEASAFPESGGAAADSLEEDRFAEPGVEGESVPTTSVASPPPTATQDAGDAEDAEGSGVLLLGELGVIRDATELRTAVEAIEAAGLSPSAVTDEELAAARPEVACLPVVSPNGGVLESIGTATVGTAPVAVLVTTTPEGRQAYAVDTACTTVLTAPLP